MPNPLISVIVPIYNVEKYVRKCLDSLKNQTMKQIEVICIDDGSTDDSGRIAEEYKDEEGWPAIRIIHTKNRGLSAARNRGIDEAKAEWIMFVDSDDWVGTEFCRVPYGTAIRENADLVIFDFNAWKGRKFQNNNRKYLPVGLIDEHLVHGARETAVWNKLFRAELFGSIRFPEGRVYEEIATTHKLVHAANRIFSLKDCLYNYLIRNGSISNNDTVLNRRDYLISVIERNEDLVSYGYQEDKVLVYSAAIRYIALEDPSNNELYKQAETILDKMEKIPKSFSIKKKMAVHLWRYDKRKFSYLCKKAVRIN